MSTLPNKTPIVIKYTPKARVLFSAMVEPYVFTDPKSKAKGKPKWSISLEIAPEQAQAMIADLKPLLDAAVELANKSSASEIKAKDLPVKKVKVKNEQGEYVETGSYKLSFSRNAAPYEGKEAKNAQVLMVNTVDGKEVFEPLTAEIGAGSLVAVRYCVIIKTVGAERCIVLAPVEIRCYEYVEPKPRQTEEWPV